MIEIKGIIECNVSLDKFIEWIENNEWIFGGITKSVDENGEVIENEGL